MREKESTNVFMKLMNRYCAKGCKKFIKKPFIGNTLVYGSVLWRTAVAPPPPKKNICPTYKLDYTGIKIDEN